MNTWINIDKNEPVSSKRTEDEVTFSAQQEPQSELESDDDDDDEQPEPIPSIKAVVQCIETTLKWAKSYKNSIRFDIMCFNYNAVIYDGPHIQWNLSFTTTHFACKSVIARGCRRIKLSHLHNYNTSVVPITYSKTIKNAMYLIGNG